MQQMNQATILALEDSNKYINDVQQYLENKDWRGIIEEAKQDYSIKWQQGDSI